MEKRNTNEQNKGGNSDHLKLRETLPTEIFIIKNLLHEDGTVRTNFAQQEEADVALSESIGLWMEYLVEKGDSEQFEHAYETLIDIFTLEENIIAWKIENGNRSTTNALIDDIRIAEALFKEGERTNRQAYIKMAKDISEAVISLNRQGDHFVDFYDASYQYANDEITISYLIPDAFRYMVKYDLLSGEIMDKILAFMKDMPLDNGFYPKYYNVKENKFYYDDTMNLIDQLYTALHMERANLSTDIFYEWLKDEFYTNNQLYGRYDRITKERAVNYEAAAVYALAILYCIEKPDHSFATDLYERMVEIRNNDIEDVHFGGYVDGTSTHSFDNLLPLLAERKLYNEQIISEK